MPLQIHFLEITNPGQKIAKEKNLIPRGPTDQPHAHKPQVVHFFVRIGCQDLNP
jgi:hypothetical protein